HRERNNADGDSPARTVACPDMIGGHGLLISCLQEAREKSCTAIEPRCLAARTACSASKKRAPPPGAAPFPRRRLHWLKSAFDLDHRRLMSASWSDCLLSSRRGS